VPVPNNNPGLFDANDYIEPTRAKRRRKRRPERTLPEPIRSDGSWVGLATRTRVLEFVHQRLLTNNPGGTLALCGARGRALTIPAGVIVNPCPKCTPPEQTTAGTG
jgi:hypothetical protein